MAKKDKYSKMKKLGKVLFFIGIVALILGSIGILVSFFGIGTLTIFNDVSTGLYLICLVVSFIVGILGFCLALAGGILMLIGHDREIKTFVDNKAVPEAKKVVKDVTKEVDKVSPKVTKAADEVVKGIEKGIDAFKKN